MPSWPYFKVALVVCAIVIVLKAGALAISFGLLYNMEQDVEELGIDGQSAFALAAIRSNARTAEQFSTEELQAIPSDARSTDVQTTDAALLAMRDDLAAAKLAPDIDAAELATGIEDLRGDFVTYLDSGTRADLLALNQSALATRMEAESLFVPVRAGTSRSFDGVVGGMRDNRIVLLLSVLGVLPITLGTILWMGRRMGSAIEVLHEREATLMEANRLMERRNQQFSGIYRIVSEVTDTLSMKYVVETTVREVRQLVRADLVVLRVLEGRALKLMGSERDEAAGPIRVSESVVLGTGTEGRAAKRGRFVHIEAAGGREDDIAGSPLPGARSVVVVPLIVGAQVVGTVSCWSRADGAFNDDDQQALEMMASQVATAIAAASLHEGSENDAYHDALTGLPNRRRLAEDMRFEFNAAVQRGRQTAVAMVDVDHFKRFNDEHGHAGGDRALQKVAQTLASGLRADDRMYRYGGEEFLIVFDKLSAGDAFEACERLRAAVAAEDILDDAAVRVTASIGLATAPDMASDFERLIGIADDALYRSKEAGRNRTTVYRKSAIEADAA